MKIEGITITSYEDTITHMSDMIYRYYTDMIHFKGITVQSMFDILAKKVKYRKDIDAIETLQRPAITMTIGGDCDDKAICACSYFIVNKVPCGLSIVSESPDKNYHHVFAFYIDNNIKRDFDCTYFHNRLHESKDWYKREDFLIWNG